MSSTHDEKLTGKVTHIGESTKIGNVGPGKSNVGVVAPLDKPGFGSKGNK